MLFSDYLSVVSVGCDAATNALEKHATQGMCLRLKTGFAQDKTLEDIIAEVELEEKADPPQPPSSDIDTLIPITAQRHIFQAPIHQTIEMPRRFSPSRAGVSCVVSGFNRPLV